MNEKLSSASSFSLYLKNLGKQPNHYQNQSTNVNDFITQRCCHIKERKWQEIWNSLVEPKCLLWTGLVFINPKFAPTFYVPSCMFRCDFIEFNEYILVDHETWINMKSEQYEQRMQRFLQPGSCFVSMHCCQVVEILDRLCLKCSKLSRISFHYYYLDDNVVHFLVANMPDLRAINFQNSIGLSDEVYKYFGALDNLIYLNLSGCDVHEGGLQRLFESCPKLSSLDISENSDITGESLSHPNVIRLKRLNISNCWSLTAKSLINMSAQKMTNLIELICNSAINDDTLQAIALGCPNLAHLDISYESFTYFDQSGLDDLSDQGFMALRHLSNLKVLKLCHVGRLTDAALNEITGPNGCHDLIKLVLNLRHRHKLTDSRALNSLGQLYCSKILYFEAVHNHFISTNSLSELMSLSNSLEVLILRGNELVKDKDAALILQNCCRLRELNLDGCRDISENTLVFGVVHARKMPLNNVSSDNRNHIFHLSMIATSIDRSLIEALVMEFPKNLCIKASHHYKNQVHYNEFDGHKILNQSLKEKFYPIYWRDYS